MQTYQFYINRTDFKPLSDRTHLIIPGKLIRSHINAEKTKVNPRLLV